MKKLIIISCLLMTYFTDFSQDQQTVAGTSCRLVYSEGSKALMIDASDAATACPDLLITSLPPTNEPLTALVLDLKKGRYTFKLDPELVMPADYYIYIEDQVTGLIYPLATENVFSFSVSRAIPNRFQLYISKRSRAISKAQ